MTGSPSSLSEGTFAETWHDPSLNMRMRRTKIKDDKEIDPELLRRNLEMATYAGDLDIAPKVYASVNVVGKNKTRGTVTGYENFRGSLQDLFDMPQERQKALMKKEALDRMCQDIITRILRTADVMKCQNDIKPGNMVYNVNGKARQIDWDLDHISGTSKLLVRDTIKHLDDLAGVWSSDEKDGYVPIPKGQLSFSAGGCNMIRCFYAIIMLSLLLLHIEKAAYSFTEKHSWREVKDGDVANGNDIYPRPAVAAVRNSILKVLRTTIFPINAFLHPDDGVLFAAGEDSLRYLSGLYRVVNGYRFFRDDKRVGKCTLRLAREVVGGQLREYIINKLGNLKGEESSRVVMAGTRLGKVGALKIDGTIIPTLLASSSSNTKRYLDKESLQLCRISPAELISNASNVIFSDLNTTRLPPQFPKTPGYDNMSSINQAQELRKIGSAVIRTSRLAANTTHDGWEKEWANLQTGLTEGKNRDEEDSEDGTEKRHTSKSRLLGSSTRSLFGSSNSRSLGSSTRSLGSSTRSLGSSTGSSTSSLGSSTSSLGSSTSSLGSSNSRSLFGTDEKNAS